MKKQAQKSEAETLARDFARKLSEFSVLASDENIQIAPYTDPTLPHFNKLSFSEQKELAARFEQYAAVMQEVKKEDNHVVRNPKTLWRMLSRLGMRPCQDLYQALDPNDVIEIYDMKGRQLFRSFNFFSVCSYTLEEMYCLAWFDLYERDEQLLKMNHDFVAEILGHPEKGTRQTPIPVHSVREIKKTMRRSTTIQPHFMSPVHDTTGKLAGFINTFQVLESTVENLR